MLAGPGKERGRPIYNIYNIYITFSFSSNRLDILFMERFLLVSHRYKFLSQVLVTHFQLQLIQCMAV